MLWDNPFIQNVIDRFMVTFYISLVYGFIGAVGGVLCGILLICALKFRKRDIAKHKLVGLYFLYNLTSILIVHAALKLADLQLGLGLGKLIAIERYQDTIPILILVLLVVGIWGFIIIRLISISSLFDKLLVTWKRIMIMWGGLTVIAAVSLILTNLPTTEPFSKIEASVNEINPLTEGIRPYSIKGKVLLLGIDAATWTVLDPMIREEQLPNFSKLVNSGVSGNLETILPTFSPILWTSIATGKEPSKHGVLDVILTKLPGMSPLPLMHGMNPPLHLGTSFVLAILSYSPLSQKIPFTSNQRRVKTLWNILSEYEKTVQLVGWFTSWPAERVNGVMVTDYTLFSSWTHLLGKDVNRDLTYPPELIKEIRPYIRFPKSLTLEEVREFMEISDSKLRDLVSRDFHVSDKLAQFRTSYLSDQSYSDISLYLAKTHAADFTAIYLNGLDPVEHFFWHYFEPQFFEQILEEEMAKYGNTIENYYRFLDDKIGQFIQAWGDELTVIIVSDHGMQATGKLPWAGNHVDTAPPGIIIMNGPNINKGIKLKGANIFDITPTILYLMGLPMGKDIDGKVLFDAIDPNFIKQYPIKYITSHDFDFEYNSNPQESEINEVIKEKLKSLGYLN
jgi:predicted AlkP superfamily phosphohydrolase/phosphomutase